MLVLRVTTGANVTALDYPHFIYQEITPLRLGVIVILGIGATMCLQQPLTVIIINSLLLTKVMTHLGVFILFVSLLVCLGEIKPMALSVAPVSNPTFTGTSAPAPTSPLSVSSPDFGSISGVIQATPGSNGFAGLDQYNQPAQQPPTTQNTGTGTGTGSGGALSTSSGQLIARSFDDQINNYNNLKNNSIPTYQNLANYNVNQDVNQQRDALSQNYQTGQANHQSAQQSLDTNHLNGVRDLGDQLRGALAGYQNQLGVQGAGNSSAAGLLGYALQQQGNKGMNDLNTQYNNQQQNMDIAGSDLDQKYTIGKAQLERFRNDSLSTIATSYLQQKDAINTALLSATGQKAIYLQNAGADLANQALEQLKQVEGQLNDGHANIDQAYQQAKGQFAGPDISQYVNGFSSTPLSTQQIQSTSLANNQPNNNQSNINAPVSLQRRDITQPF